MSDDTDPIYTERVHSKEKESDAMDAETNAGGPLFQENKDITSCGLEEALGLSQSMVAPRSTKMFTEGDGAPRMSGDDAIVKKPTKYLCKVAKEVVYELFQHHYDLVQRSWGSMLDKEEAVAYLICDCLGLELLQPEARPIGHAAVTMLIKDKNKKIGAKFDDERIMGAASGARSKARGAAEKDPAKAAALDAKLKDIELKRDQKRVELWGGDPNLPLPTAPIVASTRPLPPDPVAVATREIKQAEQELAKAEAAAVAAESERSQAERALAKLQPPGGAKRTSHDVMYFYGSGLSDEVCAQRKVELDALLVAERRVRAAEYAQTQAARDVELAGADVDLARWIHSHEQQKQQREGERKAAQAE